jgi:peroxiredoxin
MPAMQRAWEQVQDQQVLILAVNVQDRAEQVAQFFEALPVEFPVLLGGDATMMTAWSVQALPTSLVIDPQGRMRYRVIGAYHWDQPAALEALLALREPTDQPPR